MRDFTARWNAAGGANSQTLAPLRVRAHRGDHCSVTPTSSFLHPGSSWHHNAHPTMHFRKSTGYLALLKFMWVRNWLKGLTGGFSDRCFSGFFVGCACDGARPCGSSGKTRRMFSKARWARLCVRRRRQLPPGVSVCDFRPPRGSPPCYQGFSSLNPDAPTTLNGAHA